MRVDEQCRVVLHRESSRTPERRAGLPRCKVLTRRRPRSKPRICGRAKLHARTPPIDRLVPRLARRSPVRLSTNEPAMRRKLPFHPQDPDKSRRQPEQFSCSRTVRHAMQGHLTN